MVDRDSRVDWEAERRRAGSLRSRDLVRIAGRAGWQVLEGRGKGSHALCWASGRRPVAIPRKVTRRIALSILEQLRREAA